MSKKNDFFTFSLSALFLFSELIGVFPICQLFSAPIVAIRAAFMEWAKRLLCHRLFARLNADCHRDRTRARTTSITFWYFLLLL